MGVRTLKEMNALNLILTINIGHLFVLAEDLDKKLLVIKIIERSKSLRKKVLVWFNQISKGIYEILKHCKTGIKEWKNVEVRDKYKQHQLKI